MTIKASVIWICWYATTEYTHFVKRRRRINLGKTPRAHSGILTEGGCAQEVIYRLPLDRKQWVPHRLSSHLSVFILSRSHMLLSSDLQCLHSPHSPVNTGRTWPPSSSSTPSPTLSTILPTVHVAQTWQVERWKVLVFTFARDDEACSALHHETNRIWWRRRLEEEERRWEVRFSYSCFCNVYVLRQRSGESFLLHFGTFLHISIHVVLLLVCNIVLLDIIICNLLCDSLKNVLQFACACLHWLFASLYLYETW